LTLEPNANGRLWGSGTSYQGDWDASGQIPGREVSAGRLDRFGSTGSALRRGHGILATVVSTAPFVGLVGTVIGIVDAFQHIAAAGQGGVGKVSSGVAEALITTAFGIGVAIPAVWLLNYLTQRTKRLLVDMEVRAEEAAIEALGDAQRSDKTIFLAADRSLVYDRVVALMDACRAAGAERIGVVTGAERKEESRPAPR
jgi:hypothetical protein